jgi:hypothetical protein
MLYVLVGTDQTKRKEAYEKLAHLGRVTNHIYSEHVSLVEPLIDATSLFGDRIVVLMIQTLENAAQREIVTELLPKLQKSSNIFIIDEPLADANRVKSLQKHAQELYDARPPKRKDVDLFTICSLLERRDKKEVWLEWRKISPLETGEALQGILWWKWKTVWENTLLGRPSKYTKEECEFFGGKLLRAPIRAHRGEGDLKLILEEIILSI